MKKLWLFALVAVLLLALVGCGDPNYAVDTFFSAETLEEYDLTGLPVPKLENSRLGTKTIYCNLTQEEYEVYVAEVMAYLQGREDANYLCYFHTGSMMFGFFPERIFAPVTADYDLSGNHEFAYVTAEKLESEASMGSNRVKIYRETGTLKKTDFSYNTYIQIEKDTLMCKVDPCVAEHTYDAGDTYPIPGHGRSITISHCIYCDLVHRDYYPGFDYSAQYGVTVTEGQNYIFGNNQNYFPWGITSMYCGRELEIICNIPQEGNLQLLVNGEEIPVLRTSEDKVTFGFIMPEADIEIQLLLITEEDPTE